MLERQLQKKCLQYARARGAFARKVETPGHNGFPDCVFHKQGATLYVEFKSPSGTGRVSPLQLKDHERLRDAGMQVEIIDNFEAFKFTFGLWANGAKDEIR